MVRIKGILLFGGLLASFLLFSCNNKIEPENKDNPLEIVWKLNKNVEGLRNLAKACIKADSIAIFSIQYNDDGSVLYRLGMKDEGDLQLYSEIVANKLQVPELSMKSTGDNFVWSINGITLKDSKGQEVIVSDQTRTPSFTAEEGKICCNINNVIVGEYPTSKADYYARDVAMDYDLNNKSFNIRLSSGYNTSLPTVSSFRLLEENVLNRSYYKDVFLDAGIGLTVRKTLPAAKYLKLSLEGICFARSYLDMEELALQTAIVSGDEIDSNGRLLYPDGQPRFKLLFVNGGNSRGHGQSLLDEGRANMRLFVENGGSYVGTCAGAFLASNGYDGETDYPYYLSIWPGMTNHTDLSNSYTGMFIEEDSPLLKYYDFGGDHYVDSIRHNEGGYPAEIPAGTEILARFDYPDKADIHNQPSVWAFKKSVKSGRVIQEGSHPEEVSSGERRDLTAAMMLYAMEGRGLVALKGYLKNGVTREMNKTTEDNDPDYTRIGDLQTQHFATYIPPDAKNVQVKLRSSFNCDLALMMSQDSYAFSDTAEIISQNSGANQVLDFPTIREGLWYIAVQCLTTVTVEETEYGQAYTGKTEVLNGVPYQLLITWE